MADAYTRGSTYAAVNYGNLTRLVVKNDTRDVYDYESYLRFDLTQNAGVVESAVLQLVPAYLGRDVARTTYRVRLLGDSTDGWVEGNGGKDNLPAGEISWSRKAAGTGAEVTFSGSQLVRGRALALDVTPLVNQASNANRLASFQIDAISAPSLRGDVQFYSRQNATMRPALQVTFGPANGPPRAVADAATTAEDTAKIIAVLANDTDPDSDRLTLTSVTAPAHGAATRNADGTITYTPHANYFGADSFSYGIADDDGVTASGTVSVTVSAVNDPPVATNDTSSTLPNTAVTIRVLANDSDVEGSVLAVVSATQPSHGSVAINADGTLVYTPTSNYSGADSFAYTAGDGAARGTATVTLWVGSSSLATLQSLTYDKFKTLTTAEIPFLTATQIASIPNEWWFKQMSAEQRAALTTTQVQAVSVGAVGLSGLTTSQVGLLTPAQIQQVKYQQFKYLTPREVPHLTPAQIGTIESEWWFKQMTAEARAALNAPQVQGLNVAAVGINALTTVQVGQLTTGQVQQVKYQHFGYLSAREAALLTTTQIASIESEWWFKQMKPEARAVLNATQVQAINVAAVGINALTTAQINQLTVDQVQQVKYQHFAYLTAREAPLLTTTQIASIDNEWWFKQMPEAARSALTAVQVQALNVPAVGINQLTPGQINQLTTAQVQQVDFRQFGKLTAREVPLLTPAQIGAIDNEWWFTRMPLELRSLLSPQQVQALDTSTITIRTLTPAQRKDLSVAQVQSIHPSDFRHLTPEQAAQLTPAQMAAIEHYWDLHSMPDESQAALSREQLLSLSPEVFARSVGLPESFASTNDFPHTSLTCRHDTTAGQPHTDDAGKQHEHLAVFDLVAPELATHVTVASGNWSNPAVWQGGAVPGLNSRVIVSAGNTVTFDAVYVNPIKTVRVDGVLQFATQYDTQLMADTIVVDGKGTLRVGTAAQPINAGVTARILIADTGPIDLVADPNQIGRGLISHGATEMVGQPVTPYVALATQPKRGDTSLVLETAPTNWAVGHRIVLTGSWYDQHEEFEIAAINGSVVTLDHALEFNHKTPEGYGLTHYVANMNRNVVVMSQNVDVNARRGHVMFMHSQNVQVHNVGFYGLGRTDKRNPVNDPVFDEDCNLVANTGLNRRGRYAVHFHRTSVNGAKTPAVIDGSVVVDSPGWGFVNHDSFVHMADNVAFDVVGAAFVTEVGNEIGSFRRNLAIHSTGSGDGLESREDIFDFGHQGHGFWFQGPGVEVEGNIAANQEDAAFIFFTESSEAQFDAANMVDPTLAAGHTQVPVGSVPLRLVKDNVAFASGSGLETWFHMTNMTSGQSVIEGFTAWNTSRPMFIPYTGQTTIVDATLIGYRPHPWGTAIGRNDVTNNITYRRVHAAGFEVGIDAPVRRATVIEGGYFETIRGIEISTTVHKNRTVDINVDPETGEDPEFAPLTTTQLHGHTQWEIFLDGTPQVKHNDIETLFAPDIVRLGTIRLGGKQIYYLKQAADFVPFPTGATIGDGLAGLIPPELVGKTNQQLWAEFGLAPAGVIAPPDAVQLTGINGLVGSPSVYPPDLKLISLKYTNKLANYELVYIDGEGELIHDPTRVTLREGWNLITRTIHDMPRTFFVFGDTEAPTFQLSAETKLVINPLGLDFGFNVHGTILDNSFGHMSFHKKFTDLRERPIVTRPDGTQYILLEFTIRDLAGNTTAVALELVLDPTAPVIQGTEQRDLPPRELAVTLYELLEYYMITGQTDLTDLALPPLVL